MKEKILHLLASKKAVVGIVGAGYVGLPLAQLISKKFNIILYDHDEKKVDKIKNTKNKLFRKKDKAIITNEIRMLRKTNLIIICLPTPLKRKREPDLSHIHSFFRKKNYFISPNQTIILESTSYPGTSEEIIKKYFSSKKFKFGENIFFGYSPERVDPGRNINLNKIPKIVSGFSPNCKKIVRTFYSKIFNKVFETSTMSTAEITKLYENIYRSVNIALVNEMKMISSKLGLDIYEIINAAKTKPFGFSPFNPGPGMGGHCVPIDPFYLSWKMKKYNMKTNFIELAGKINSQIPNWILEKTIKFLKKKKKSLINSKILIIGMSYKKNVDDVRLSPSISLINKIAKKTSKIDYYDPYVKKISTSTGLYKNMKSLKLDIKMLKKSDITMILTDHDNIDYKKIYNFSKLIIDTRGVYKNFKSEKILNV
jgi:UDP-N-acetyl-D-glucosamine dehydrogenase